MKNSLFCIIFILLLFLSPALFGFSFQPLQMEFAPTGRGAVQTFRIENSNEKPIGVKVTMQTREVRPDGTEINRDASDLFVVYPPQVLLQPGEYQAVRVKWIGPEEVETEKAFRIVAEQLPIQFDRDRDGGGRINIMLKYKGSVYIVPTDRRMKVEVLSVYQTVADGDEKKVVLELENSGNVHVLLEDLTVTLTSKADNGVVTERLLEGDELDGMAEVNILAGARRIFVLDWPGGLQGENLHAKLDFNYTP